MPNLSVILPAHNEEATGANPVVIAGAFRDLVRFRRRLSREMDEERRSL